MSFREKTAWVSFVALLVATALYALHVPTLVEPQPRGWVLHSILACAGVFLAIELTGWIVLRLRHPRDAREPRDELDELIHLKALRLGAYTYFVASFAAIFVTVHLVGASPASVGVAVLLAFVVSQLVVNAARIAYYRRNA